jgi:hypothetical protein
MGTNDERRGRVVKRLRGLDSEPIGRAHANPLFDRGEYEIDIRRMQLPRICLLKWTVKATSSCSSYRKLRITRRTTAQPLYRMEWSKAPTVKRDPRLQQEDGPF